MDEQSGPEDSQLGGARCAPPPATPPLAGVVAVLAAVGAVVVLMCTAGAFVLGDAEAARVQRRSERDVEALQKRRDAEIAVEGVFDQLEGFLLSLHADSYSFPESLPELAPDDPWGRPIRYERVDSDRARLESDGPDRRPNTADDITRVVDAG